MAAALDACYGPAGADAGALGRRGAGSSGVGPVKGGAGGEYAAGRALILEPFVQDR